MEIRCQIIFIKHRFWKIHELETFGTRKRILRKKLEGCTCARKRSVVFWTFHTFPCIFFPRAIFRAFANKQMYGKLKTRLDAFWHSYIPPIFFLKSFPYCQKFPIHEFFRSDVLWKLFDIGFPYKHSYFEPVCLSVKMASKTVIRPITSWIFNMWPLSNGVNFTDVKCAKNSSYTAYKNWFGLLSEGIKIWVVWLKLALLSCRWHQWHARRNHLLKPKTQVFNEIMNLNSCFIF